MARKKLQDYIPIDPHVPIAPRKSIQLFCPLLKSKGSKDILSCLYHCPKSRLIKCVEYTRCYPLLLTFEIEEKYIEKYGHPEIPLPVSLRRRRKRRNVSTRDTTTED